MEVTAQQLKELDPRQFEKEYWHWVDNCIDTDWWEHVQAAFAEDVYPLGVRVDYIQFDLHDRWAQFEGKVTLAEWFKHYPLKDDRFLLQQALIDDNAYIMAAPRHRTSMSFDWYENTAYSSPTGVFADMDEDDWTAMLHEMWGGGDVEVWVEDDIKGLCHDLLKRLEEAYDWETCEERFLESCECNEIKFDYQGDDDEIQG